MKRLFLFLLPLSLLIALFGCAMQRSVLDPSRTIAPETPYGPNDYEPVPTPYVSAAVSPSPSASDDRDEMGLEITGEEHFEKYISYHDLVVYEQDGYTYMDGVIKNDYPNTLVCVLDICFYENNEQVARARVYTGDGSSLLVLLPDETRIYADIKTDMPVTMLDFKFETVGDPVAPFKENS